MIGRKCPVCGETTLMEKTGTFQMELPPHFSEGPLVIDGASWMHCESCGEDILSPELERAINSHCHEVSRTG